MFYDMTWLERILFLKRKGGGGTPAHEATSYTGSFFTDMIAPLKKLLVGFVPKQDLHGYDKPWGGGNGKNKFDASTALVGYYISDSSGKLISGDNTNVVSDYIEVEAGQTYKISPTLSSGNWGAWYDENKAYISGIVDYSTAKTAPSNAKYMRFTVTRNGSNPNYATTTQVEKGSTATSYEPYSNICPISGHTEVVTIVSPTTDAEDGTTYTTTLGRTVYGDTLDVVSGELVVDRAMIVLDGTQAIQITNWRASENGVGWLYPYSVTNNAFLTSGTAIANIVSDKLQSQSYNNLYGQNVGIGLFTGTAYGIALWQGDTSLTTKEAINAYLAQNPITVVYELATPQTYQLTPQQINSLIGQNNIILEDGVEVSEIVYMTRLVGSPMLGSPQTEEPTEETNEEPVEESEEVGEDG